MNKEMIIGGYKINYRLQDSGQGPVYVFLHGWGSDLQAFASLYQTINNYAALDFPGHGKSQDLRQAETVESLVTVVGQWLDKLGLAGRELVLVCHSLGGRVALRLLHEADYQVNRVVYIGVPFVREHTTRGKLGGYMTWAKPLFTLPLVGGALRTVVLRMMGAGDYLALGDDEVRKQTFQGIVGHDLQPYYHVWADHRSDFVWGADDDMAPLSLNQPVIEQQGGGLQVITGAGHFPFIDKPAEFQKIWGDIIGG